MLNHCHMIDIETSSACNRQCRLCIRNSNPNRHEVTDWFTQHLMPMEVIEEILSQAAVNEFRHSIIVSHYNEPLLDPRIVEIARLAKSYDMFSVRLVTNGDRLTPQLAGQLDGVLDEITISLYLRRGARRQQKKKELSSLFSKTKPHITNGVHGMVHFHPEGNVAAVVDQPCHRTTRLIINHRGQYLLCCDDMIGHFSLGVFPQVALEEYWNGQKRAEIVNTLSHPGGRKEFPYCRTCPRVDLK